MIENANYFLLPLQKLHMEKIKTDELILDIGGGGEGIIGCLNGSKVIAIDLQKDVYIPLSHHIYLSQDKQKYHPIIIYLFLNVLLQASLYLEEI